jgi:hypothetical protein
MLADTSISRADVSKAKPQRGPAGHRGTRTLAGGRTGGGKQWRRRGIPTSGMELRRRRGGGLGAAAEEEGRGAGGGAVLGRGATSRRCTA